MPKVGVVFDTAAKHDGKSLNDTIWPEPKLQRELVDVLTCFCRAPVALSADISEMFLQVELQDKHHPFHRRDFDTSRVSSVWFMWQGGFNDSWPIADFQWIYEEKTESSCLPRYQKQRPSGLSKPKPKPSRKEKTKGRWLDWTLRMTVIGCLGWTDACVSQISFHTALDTLSCYQRTTCNEISRCWRPWKTRPWGLSWASSDLVTKSFLDCRGKAHGAKGNRGLCWMSPSFHQEDRQSDDGLLTQIEITVFTKGIWKKLVLIMEVHSWRDQDVVGQEPSVTCVFSLALQPELYIWKCPTH